MEFASLLRRREGVSADGERGQNVQALGHSLLTGAEKEATAETAVTHSSNMPAQRPAALPQRGSQT